MTCTVNTAILARRTTNGPLTPEGEGASGLQSQLSVSTRYGKNTVYFGRRALLIATVAPNAIAASATV